MQPLRKKKCFHNPNAISMQFHSYEQSLTSWYLNQANRLHVCAVYSLRVCKRMLQFRPAMALKIGTPTVLSACAVRPCLFRSVAQLQWHNFLIGKIAPSIICARLSRRKCSGASLLRGKSALHQVQTSNDTCFGVESKLHWVQDRALSLLHRFFTGVEMLACNHNNRRFEFW